MIEYIKRYFNIISHYGKGKAKQTTMKIMVNMRYNSVSPGMAKKKGSVGECGEAGTIRNCWWVCQMR